MKKLINTCLAIQTLFAVIAALTIILMATAVEPSAKVFITMGVVFLVAVIIALIMTLVINIAKEIDFKRQNKSNPVDEDDALPEVNEIEVRQANSARAFYDCKFDRQGIVHITERRQVS